MTHAELTTRAFESLKSFLTTKAQTNPTEWQLKALYALMDNLSRLAFGEMTGRYAWALPVGCGKTQSITHWCSAVVKSHLDFGVAIACSQVNALNAINDFLVKELHVPQSRIGTLVGRDRAKDVTGRHVFDGSNSQILLMTHARVHMGESELVRYWHYHGQERHVLCFDESLISAQSVLVSAPEVRRSYDLFVGACQRKEISITEEFEGTVKRLTGDFEKNMTTLKKQVEKYILDHSSPDGPDGRAARVPDELRYANVKLDAVDTDRFMQDLQTLASCSWSTPLLAFLNLCEQPMRLVVTERGEESMISDTVTVPSKIDRMVILDASGPIRLLTTMDTNRIIPAEKLPLVREAGITNLSMLFDYSNVTIHRYNAGGGRDSFQKDRNNTRIKDAVALLKTIPKNEGVLFFCFKTHGDEVTHLDGGTFTELARVPELRLKQFKAGFQHKKKNLKELLEKELIRQGYDLQSPFIRIETFGKETSSNDYVHCKRIIFVGTPWQNVTAMIATALGQLRNIHRHLEDQLVKDLYDSEAAYRLHQGLGRGACRRLGQDGRPQEMRGYLFLTDKQWNCIGPLLKKVLPGVRTPEQTLPKQEQRESKINRVTQALTAEVRKVYKEGAYSADIGIRLSSLRQVLGLPARSDVFTRAVNNFLRENPSWKRQGKSLVLVGAEAVA
jgi:hypothetical protein